jgi:hypothetical protein
MYVFMHACIMHACMYECMFVWIHACMDGVICKCTLFEYADVVGEQRGVPGPMFQSGPLGGGVSAVMAASGLCV